MYSSANEETICGCHPVHDMLTAVAVASLCTAQALRVLTRHRRAGYAPLCTAEAAACEPRGRRMDAVYKKSGLPFLLQRLSASLLWCFPSCSSVLLPVGISWSPSSASLSQGPFVDSQRCSQWHFSNGSSLFQAAVFLSAPMPSLVCDLKCPIQAQESCLCPVCPVWWAGCGQGAAGLVPLIGCW